MGLERQSVRNSRRQAGGEGPSASSLLPHIQVPYAHSSLLASGPSAHTLARSAEPIDTLERQSVRNSRRQAGGEGPSASSLLPHIQVPYAHSSLLASGPSAHTLARSAEPIDTLERDRRSQIASSRGLTLIELLVALLIVAGIMTLAVPSVQSVTGMRVREEAGRLAGAIAYLYNHTAVTGRTCRLVFAMGADDGDGWTAECTEDPPRLGVDTLQVRRGVLEQRTQDDPWFRRSARDDDTLERRVKEQARWNQFASRAVRPVRLSSGVHIGGLWTPRFSETVTEGEAHLYFFPTGETQRALIYIVDSRENAYTLDVQPLTGRVRVLHGWEEVPRG